MQTKRGSMKKTLITAVLSGSLIGLTLLIFETFQAVVGHGIAIASVGATALIVVFNPKSPGASPKAIFLGYVIAGLISLGITYFVVLPQYALAAIIIGIISGIQMYLGIVHPPAVAYSLSYVYGGYALNEFLLTIPAILGFFVAFGVLAFVLQIISSLFIHKEKSDTSKKYTRTKKIELFIDALIPYSLVVLFISIILELTHSEIMDHYKLLVGVIDWGIIALFSVDLYFKYKKVASAKEFFRKYWMDIIATIPLFVVLRISRGFIYVFRMEAIIVQEGARITSLSKLLKPIARFPRFAKLIEKIEGVE